MPLPLFQDPEIEATAMFQQNSKCIEVLMARNARRRTAIETYMQEYSKPLLTLDGLQTFVAYAQQRVATGRSTTDLEADLQTRLNDIATNNYAQLGTPEMDYRDQYIARLEAFVWPSAEELTVRQQEEADIISLLI